MPVTAQQKKANALNRAGWRADKHLRSSQFNGRGRPGAGFFSELGHAVRVGWLQQKRPAWGKGIDYYRLTPKGRRYLQKQGFQYALKAFRMPEAIKLSGSRAELQRQGWFSVKHVGWVDDKLIEAGYYEISTQPRRKMNGTFFRLTPAGKVWAKRKLRRKSEAGLRASFKWQRARETEQLTRKISLASELINAWH